MKPLGTPPTEGLVGIVHPRLVRLFDCSAEEGIELGFRLVNALGELRALLDRINELPQRRPVLECVDHRQNRPNASNNHEQDKQCLPSSGRESKGVLETAGAKCGDECSEEGNRSDPSLVAADALKVIAQAEFEPVFGDNNDILIKIRMNLHLLDIIRREGFRELRLGGVGDLTHCSLHSCSPLEVKSQPSTQERPSHEN